MKKIKMIISILSTILCIMIIVTNFAYAWDASTKVSEIDATNGDSSVKEVATNIMGTIINVIRIIGTGVAIIMITYVAIKYMSAAPSEKAEFKKSATAFIIGAIVLFASTNILYVIAKFATSNIKTTSTGS